MTPETAAEIAAYIGAAAWVPQIVTWLYSAATSPKLSFMSAQSVELGFSSFGPIVNMTMGVATKRKDALIERLTLVARHERGETRTLVWQWLNEVQQQMRDASGNITQVSKNNVAVALKVSTLSVTEKIVGFQDAEFSTFSNESTESIRSHFDYLCTRHTRPDALEELFRSREFQEVAKAFESRMYWQEGKYTFTVSAKIQGERSQQQEVFELSLTQNQVRLLRDNCKNLESVFRNGLATANDANIDINWNWAYPRITRKGQEQGR